MDDLISRKEAINSQVKMIAQGLDWVPVYHLEQLPSVERRGRWEVCEDGTLVRCSVCGMRTTRNKLMGISLFGETEPHYCPNCGARMEATE